jgi:phage shock protein A
MRTTDRQLEVAQTTAEYYRDRYEMLQQAEHQRQQDEYDRDRERQRTRQERCEEALRDAADWPEALRHQAVLHEREAHLEDASDPDEDHYFTHTAQACRLALAIWEEEAAAMQPQIAALETQIAALKTSISLIVADRLVLARADTIAADIAAALRDPQINFYNWLHW